MDEVLLKMLYNCDAMFYFSNKKNKGFTLIELLIVIAIIGILSTLSIVALGSAREKARNSKRLADIKQISTALELYYADNGAYPDIITPGQALVSPDQGTTYLATIPSNPVPRTDGQCSDSDYTYSNVAGKSYYLFACLGSEIGSLLAGPVSYGPDSGFTSGCGTVVDVDGNSYETVVIGSQCWMKENLRVGYRVDGIYNQDTPVDDIIDRYCYDDTDANCDIYGGLYQWHTAMALDQACDTSDCSAQIQSPHRGICPGGWHIPSENDLTDLTDYLSFEGQGGPGDIDDIAGKLKEAGLDHWVSEVCDDGAAPIGTCNSSNFTARGSGICDPGGFFQLLNSGAVFWSTLQKEDNSNFSWARDLANGDSAVYKTSYEKLLGASVRCMKD